MHATKIERGFTLIELLIALALFSIMSLLAWRGLDTVLQSRAAVEAPGRAALELAAAWTQLEADLHAARTAAQSVQPAPHITASAQQLTLLRAPAHCAGCWEGVVYDITQRDGDTVLRRRATAAYSDAEAARTALSQLTANTRPATEHVLLRGATKMRIGAWRELSGAGAWQALGATGENVFPATSASTQSPAKAALKIEWQLAAPWDGWVSKIVLLENRW